MGEVFLGQLPVGSRCIVSSGQYCAFDGCLHKDLRKPFIPLFSNVLGDIMKRCMLFVKWSGMFAHLVFDIEQNWEDDSKQM